MYECWAEMKKLVDDGLVRNIGISNFNVQSTLDLLTYYKYKPATLEIEHHLYLQLRWGVQRDVVVIPKSVNVNRMNSNLDLFSFKLDEQEMEEIAALDAKARFNYVCPGFLDSGIPIFD